MNVFGLDPSEFRRGLEEMTPRECRGYAAWAGEARDVAVKYGFASLADEYQELALIAADVAESLARLGSDADDAVNPFQPCAPPEMPGDESSTG